MQHSTKTIRIINVRLIVLLLFSLILMILGTHIIISTATTQKILVEQKQDFLVLLSKNMAQKLVTSFIIPAIHSYGRVSLVIPEQYNTLHTIIEEGTEGFDITETTIFSANNSIIYTSAPKIPQIPYTFLLESAKSTNALFFVDFPSLWEIFWGGEHKATIRSYYPIFLNINTISLLSSNIKNEQELWGIIEFSMDCTEDIQQLQNTYRNFSISTFIMVLCALLGITMIIHKTNTIAQAKVEALENIKKKLAHKERLASIGKMVASLAHEIRNPLGIVYSSIQLLLKNTSTLEPRITSILERMAEEITTLRTLVNAFLDYAKPSTIDNSPTKIFPIIESVCNNALENYEDMEKKNTITITIDISHNCTLSFGRDALQRAMINLISNALEAPNVTHITITSSKDDTFFFICVLDNGIGFTEQEEIYTEPFFTTKDYGTGLGLSIVKASMELYGGTICLSNREEGGACICLKIPLERLLSL